jgi:hypothetical protein
MNFAIRYLTEYRYKSKVTDNLNALRVRPATTSTQRVDDFHVRIDPEARLTRAGLRSRPARTRPRAASSCSPTTPSPRTAPSTSSSRPRARRAR